MLTSVTTKDSIESMIESGKLSSSSLQQKATECTLSLCDSIIAVISLVPSSKSLPRPCIPSGIPMASIVEKQNNPITSKIVNIFFHTALGTDLTKIGIAQGTIIEHSIKRGILAAKDHFKETPKQQITTNLTIISPGALYGFKSATATEAKQLWRRKSVLSCMALLLHERCRPDHNKHYNPPQILLSTRPALAALMSSEAIILANADEWCRGQLSGGGTFKRLDLLQLCTFTFRQPSLSHMFVTASFFVLSDVIEACRGELSALLLSNCPSSQVQIVNDYLESIFRNNKLTEDMFRTLFSLDEDIGDKLQAWAISYIQSRCQTLNSSSQVFDTLAGNVRSWVLGKRKTQQTETFKALSRVQNCFHTAQLNIASINESRYQQTSETMLLKRLAVIGNLTTYLGSECETVEQSITAYERQLLSALHLDYTSAVWPIPKELPRSQDELWNLFVTACNTTKSSTYARLIEAVCRAESACGSWPVLMFPYNSNSCSQFSSSSRSLRLRINIGPTKTSPSTSSLLSYSYASIMQCCREYLVHYLCDQAAKPSEQLPSISIDEFGTVNGAAYRCRHSTLKSAMIKSDSFFGNAQSVLSKLSLVDIPGFFKIRSIENDEFTPSLPIIDKICLSIPHSGLRLATMAVVLLVGGKYVNRSEGILLLAAAISEIMSIPLQWPRIESPPSREFCRHWFALYMEVLGHCLMINDATNETLCRGCDTIHKGLLPVLPTLWNSLSSLVDTSPAAKIIDGSSLGQYSVTDFLGDSLSVKEWPWIKDLDSIVNLSASSNE